MNQSPIQTINNVILTWIFYLPQNALFSLFYLLLMFLSKAPMLKNALKESISGVLSVVILPDGGRMILDSSIFLHGTNVDLSQ